MEQAAWTAGKSGRCAASCLLRRAACRGTSRQEGFPSGGTPCSHRRPRSASVDHRFQCCRSPPMGAGFCRTLPRRRALSRERPSRCRDCFASGIHGAGGALWRRALPARGWSHRGAVVGSSSAQWHSSVAWTHERYWPQDVRIVTCRIRKSGRARDLSQAMRALPSGGRSVASWTTLQPSV